jgi:hypothetical protein
MKQCQCVFPTVGEEELLTVPGTEPGTAFRLFAETSQDGYVRLQQLAFDAGLGWYVQKTMVIPADVLKVILPQLRKTQCLMPPQAPHAAGVESVPFMRLADAAAPGTTQRRAS